MEVNYLYIVNFGQNHVDAAAYPAKQGSRNPLDGDTCRQFFPEHLEIGAS